VRGLFLTERPDIQRNIYLSALSAVDTFVNVIPKKITSPLILLFFPVAAGLFGFGLLLLEEWHVGRLDVFESGLEALAFVDDADLGLHRRRLPDGGEKLIRGHLDEAFGPFLRLDPFLMQNPLPGKERQHGVADPGLGAFFFFRHHVIRKEVISKNKGYW